MEYRSLSPRTCNVEGCSRAHWAKGYCEPHYKQTTKGRPLTPVAPSQPRPCSRHGCSKPRYALGYCKKHYVIHRDAPSCSEPDCENPILAKGMCRSHYRRAERKRAWEHVIERLGGKCSRCGGVFPIAVYDLHHRDPTTKDFSFGGQMGNISRARLLAEVEKCDLLCANCHRILHFA